MQLGADLGRDYHQSTASSISSPLQNGAERYFQPPSASTATTTEPSGSSSAMRRATCTTAPAETPANKPFAVEQHAHGGCGLGVRDEQLPVELVDVEDRRDVAVLERAEAHHGIARAAARPRRSARRGTPRAGARRCPSACRRCRGPRRARRRGGARARSPRRSPRSARAGSPRSRTGRASRSGRRALRSPARGAPRRSSRARRATR